MKTNSPALSLSLSLSLPSETHYFLHLSDCLSMYLSPSLIRFSLSFSYIHSLSQSILSLSLCLLYNPLYCRTLRTPRDYIAFGFFLRDLPRARARIKGPRTRAENDPIPPLRKAWHQAEVFPYFIPRPHFGIGALDRKEIKAVRARTVKKFTAVIIFAL